MGVVVTNRHDLLSVEEPHRARRARAVELVEAAIAGVDPYLATKRLCPQIAIPRGNTLHVLAFGKAAVAMARAALDELPVAGGIVIGPGGAGAPLGPLTFLSGCHPDPSPDAAAHGQQVLDYASRLQETDSVVCLVSGGGSALLELPRPGISLADLSRTSRMLMDAGADITALNTVRLALSQLKGGGLLRALGPANVTNLVLSDVVAQPLSWVASGPSMAPPNPQGLGPEQLVAWQRSRAATVVRELGVSHLLPPSVAALLLAQTSALRQSAGPGVALPNPQTLVVGDNDTARTALCRHARALGLTLSSMPGYALGEARLAARQLLEHAGVGSAQPRSVAWGGETLVHVAARAGRGGRNQELVLAGSELLREATEPGLLVSFGTDGVDGNSDAAGALMDAPALARLSQGRALRALAESDSHTALLEAGATLHTGPTGTNVADLMFWLQ